MGSRDRWAEIRVGAFVLTALLILILGSLWMAGSSFLGQRHVEYRVMLRDSASVQPGDRVRVAGVAVGRIREVHLRAGEQWPVLLRVSVKHALGLRADSSASIVTSGLLGSSFLEIEPGSPSQPLLEPGGEIYGTTLPSLDDTLASLDEISNKLISILDQTSAVLDSVSAELGPILGNMDRLLSDENVRNVEQLLATLRDTAGEAGPRLTTMLERLDTLSTKLDAGADDLPELTADLQQLVGDLRAALGADGERLVRVLDAADSSLRSADAALGAIGGNRTEVEATLSDLRQTVGNLKAFSQQIKERPFSLVRAKQERPRKPGEGVTGDTK